MYFRSADACSGSLRDDKAASTVHCATQTTTAAGAARVRAHARPTSIGRRPSAIKPAAWRSAASLARIGSLRCIDAEQHAGDRLLTLTRQGCFSHAAAAAGSARRLTSLLSGGVASGQTACCAVPAHSQRSDSRARLVSARVQRLPATAGCRFNCWVPSIQCRSLVTRLNKRPQGTRSTRAPPSLTNSRPTPAVWSRGNRAGVVAVELASGDMSSRQEALHAAP
jgi:hypothetical protein